MYFKQKKVIYSFLKTMMPQEKTFHIFPYTLWQLLKQDPHSILLTWVSVGTQLVSGTLTPLGSQYVNICSSLPISSIHWHIYTKLKGLHSLLSATLLTQCTIQKNIQKIMCTLCIYGTIQLVALYSEHSAQYCMKIF